MEPSTNPTKKRQDKLYTARSRRYTYPYTPCPGEGNTIRFALKHSVSTLRE